MISLGVFLPGCEAGDQNIGASGIDNDRPVERFKYDSPEQVEELAQKLNYTPEAWQAGIREVPRLYITTIPSRWRDKTSDAMPVVDEKRALMKTNMLMATDDAYLGDGPTILLIPIGAGS